MKNLTVGTLVMLHCPPPLKVFEPLRNGVIGEVVADHPNNPVAVVTVNFPGHESTHSSKLWGCKRQWLIPISNPDLGVEDYTEKNVDTKIDEYFEEHA